MYLPWPLTEDTVFPEAWGKDVRTQIRMIEETYRRHRPKIDYYQIKKATTPAILTPRCTLENSVIGFAGNVALVLTQSGAAIQVSGMNSGDALRKATGSVAFVPVQDETPVWVAQPKVGDTVAISDGTTAFTFEFRDTAPPTGTNVLVLIGTDAAVTMQNFIAAVNAQAFSVRATDAAPASQPISSDVLSGEPGNSKFDILWGESVDATQQTWKQPHLSGTVKAADVEEFFDPIEVHARVQRILQEKELKKVGFDEVRQLDVFVPLSILDGLNIVINAGDKFMWDAEWYTAKQFELVGYWKNTNVRLFGKITAEHLRTGS